MCLAALGPSVHHHVGLARRYELYALSSAGESGGNSPRLLVTGWLCYRRYYRGTPTTLSSWSPSPPPMPPPTPPPPGVVNLQTATGHSSLSSCAAGCRERCDIEETTSANMSYYCTRTIMRPRRLRHPRHPRRRRRRLRYPCRLNITGHCQSYLHRLRQVSSPLTARLVFASVSLVAVPLCRCRRIAS